MPSTVNLDEAADRPIRRDLDVGLTEICVGLITLMIGSMMLLWSYHFSEFSPWIAAMVFILAGYFIRKANAKFRSNEEFPRIGYTKLKPRQAGKISQRTAGIILVLLVCGYSLMNPSGIGKLTQHETVMALAYALVVSGCFFYIALKYRMPSAIWVGLFSVAWGVLAYFWAGSNATSWTMLGIGSVMTMDGLWHFVRFRRTHPKLEAPES